MKTQREVARVIASVPTSDGAGVKLRRSLGARPGDRVDPFLMLDEFYSDDPKDYLAGFPAHPHRGFETVTYMLDGHLRHEDHLGNRGDLQAGGVQWMTAGRGIIHSEMPQQTEGRMRGFQLWLNLPARDKLCAAGYRDLQPEEIPEVRTAAGGAVKVIAGRLQLADESVAGPVNGEPGAYPTDPHYLDVRLAPGEVLELPLAPRLNGLAYCYEGEVAVGSQQLPRGSAAVLGSGDQVRLEAGVAGASLLLLAGQPLDEPVAQYGPFVMNTRAELEQALADYRDGRLTAEV